jgi:hypothetical protein
MTICIAAFSAESKAIVCIADRALTYLGYGANSESDSGVAKIIELPGNWCALFSCDSLTFPKRVLDKIDVALTGKTSVSRLEIEAAAKKAYEETWWDEIEDQILKPILLTRKDFAARAQDVQPLDSKLVLKLAEEMSAYKQICSMIFCGFEGENPQMFVAYTPCQIDPHDWQGFACIGSGLETARNQMLWSDYDKDDALESTLYDVFNAKVATEVLQGVGYVWDWRILLPGKNPEPVPEKIDKQIDQLWILHNRHPFAPKLKDIEAKRAQVAKSISDYAASLVPPQSKRVKRQPTPSKPQTS